MFILIAKLAGCVKTDHPSSNLCSDLICLIAALRININKRAYLYMCNILLRLYAKIIIIKTFCFVLKVLDRSFNDAFLKGVWSLYSRLMEEHVYGYMILHRSIFYASHNFWLVILERFMLQTYFCVVIDRHLEPFDEKVQLQP